MAENPAHEKLTLVTGFTPLRPEAQYLGEHALLAVSGVYQQRFRRFAYRDIEALIIQPTRTQVIWSLFLGLGLLFGILMLVFGGGGFRIFGGILSGVSVLSLVVNLAWGQGCRTFLQTRVQRFRLGNVGRLPKAERLRAELWARVEQVQGRVTAADIRAWAAQRQAEREAEAAQRRAGLGAGGRALTTARPAPSADPSGAPGPDAAEPEAPRE